MKQIKYFIIGTSLFIQSIFSLEAQNTEGKEFWITCGDQWSTNPQNNRDIRIRIANGNSANWGTIYFTELKTTINFNIPANGLYTYTLTLSEIDAVMNGNGTPSITNHSIEILVDKSVSVYVYNHRNAAQDATIIFPITALGTDYYQISYAPVLDNPNARDAYAVVATQNNTNVYHNGILEAANLSKGQVYYRTSNNDMTGSRISSNNPVAFYALNQTTKIPYDYNYYLSLLMQQLPPINSWGKKYFVPVSNLIRDRVRVVASENNTTITQTGGDIFSPPGQPGYTLQAGQFVELDIYSDSTGCYIQSDKPIGVCAYLTSSRYNFPTGMLGPSQTWISSIEQVTPHALVAPFTFNFNNPGDLHYAIIVTKTESKNNTTVSISGASATSLSGGSWKDNTDIGMSYYIFPMTQRFETYYFTNTSGLIVYCFGDAYNVTYYYLGGSDMRDLQATFYANEIPYQLLKENSFCEGEVSFQAEIEGLHPTATEKIKWYVNGAHQPEGFNQETWSRSFSVGEYEIRMWVHYENEDTISKTGTLIIKSCNQSAMFYKNDVHYLTDTTFCNKNVNFRAEIEGLHPTASDKIRWYVYGVEETSALNLTEWGRPFENGTYEIKMEVHYDNDEYATRIGILKVQAFWIKMRNIKH